MALFLPIAMVDDDVRFVMELTTNQWPYRHYIIRRLLFFVDRVFDAVLSPTFISLFSRSVSGFVCLVLYIIFRLISLVLCYTKLCKCYAVRTVIPCILSGLICIGPSFAVMLLDPEFTYDAVVQTVVIGLCIYCIFYVGPILLTVRRFTFVDEDIFPHQVKSNVMVRTYVMLVDGNATIFDIIIFALSYQFSVSWLVCLIIFIILRLISFKLSYNTKPYKFYAKWTFNAWAISISLCLVMAIVSYVFYSASIGNHTLPSNSTYVNSSFAIYGTGVL